jgi:hypothetical protein
MPGMSGVVDLTVRYTDFKRFSVSAGGGNRTHNLLREPVLEAGAYANRLRKQSKCRRGDLNPHETKSRQILSLLRLPFRHSGQRPTTG